MEFFGKNAYQENSPAVWQTVLLANRASGKRDFQGNTEWPESPQYSKGDGHRRLAVSLNEEGILFVQDSPLNRNGKRAHF